MSFELNIMVLHQETASPDSIEAPFKFYIESNEIRSLGYFWPFMSLNKGIWYEVGIEKNDFFSALPIIETDFEKVEDSDLPYWVDDEDVKENLTSFRMIEAYKNDLVRLIRNLLKQSPIKSIMLMSRYQGGDKEVICGVLSLDEFLELEAKGKILFNVCYIIRQVE